MRYKLEKLSWDGTEYFGIVDTETGENICTEKVNFYAYPEGPFIETEEGGKEKLELIVKILNLIRV